MMEYGRGRRDAVEVEEDVLRRDSYLTADTSRAKFQSPAQTEAELMIRKESSEMVQRKCMKHCGTVD